MLTDAELVEIWQYAGGGSFGPIVRLLILTGQRREEVGGMAWSELQGDLWRIRAERAKNGVAHDVPLSPQARAIIAEPPQQADRDIVFGAASGPFQGWSKSKENLDRRIAEARKGRLANQVHIDPWRIHDIRRTVATRMADLGVLPHVIEAVLNHVSGHKAGVVGVYNRSSYASEKQAALELWGAHVKQLVCAEKALFDEKGEAIGDEEASACITSRNFDPSHYYKER